MDASIEYGAREAEAKALQHVVAALVATHPEPEALLAAVSAAVERDRGEQAEARAFTAAVQRLLPDYTPAG